MENQLEQGLAYSLVGIIAVFSALFLMFAIFRYIMPALIDALQRSRLKAKGLKSDEILSQDERAISGEVNAAIAAAIYNYFDEIHDEEDTVLTINKVKKSYSPWSSKIYNTYSNRMGMRR